MLSNFFLQIKLILLQSMLDPLFYLTYSLITLLAVSINFITDVRVNKIINILLKLELPLCNEAHIEHPFLIVLIFQTYFHKLLSIKFLIMIKIVFLELVFIDFFYLVCLNFSFFEIIVVLQTDPCERQ